MKIKHILLFLMAWVSSMSLAYAQQTVVASGSVMDEKGELLIGVSISVKEVPSMGAITDIDGRFKIGGIKNEQEQRAHARSVEGEFECNGRGCDYGIG